MQFSEEKFKSILESDLWLLEKFLVLPNDPPPIITKDGDYTDIEITDTFSLNDQRRAIEVYRNKILPSIFVIGQKVYSEIFRLLLINNGYKVEERQVGIEKKIKLTLNEINIWKPFSTKEEFIDWWNGTYNFRKIRLARNNVIHNRYQFDGKKLKVSERSGELLIFWSNLEIINFTEKVLKKAITVI